MGCLVGIFGWIVFLGALIGFGQQFGWWIVAVPLVMFVVMLRRAFRAVPQSTGGEPAEIIEAEGDDRVESGPAGMPANVIPLRRR